MFKKINWASFKGVQYQQDSRKRRRIPLPALRKKCIIALAVMSFIARRRTAVSLLSFTQLFVGTPAHHSLAFVQTASLGNFGRFKQPPQLIAYRSQPSISSSHSSHDASTTLGLWGGDFAGLYATFDLRGNVIPIPEYLLPPTLVEWGQEPLCLEVLVSEDKGSRCTLTILPAIGCSVDNLETMKSWQTLECRNATAASVSAANSTRACFHGATGSHDTNLKMEASFRLNDNHRVRAVVTVHRGSGRPVPPVEIFLERHVCPASSNGTIADGGGLDGQRVSRLLGERLCRSYDFPAQITVSGEANDDNHDTRFFPGNITIVAREDADADGMRLLEIGHFHDSEWRVVQTRVGEDGNVSLHITTRTTSHS